MIDPISWAIASIVLFEITYGMLSGDYVFLSLYEKYRAFWGGLIT